MVRRRLWMERRKVSTVTRVTVTRRGLADGNTDPGSGCGVMAADTRVMRICCSAYQRCISMTGTTLRSGNSNDTRMIKRGCRMQRLPGNRMTGSTVTAGGKVLTNG